MQGACQTGTPDPAPNPNPNPKELVGLEQKVWYEATAEMDHVVRDAVKVYLKKWCIDMAIMSIVVMVFFIQPTAT